MSVRALLLIALALGVARSGFSQDTGPNSFAPEIRPIEDYEHVWTRSPFVVESKVVAESDPLAQKYALAAIARTGGEPRVWLIERASLQRIMLPSEDQALQLVSVSMDRDMRKSSAVIRLGSEQASITFDEQLLNVSGGVAPAPAVYNGAGPASQLMPRTHPQTTGRQPPSGGGQSTVPTPAVPPPPVPGQTIARPGIPTTPEQDGADDAEAPKTKKIIKRPTINTQPK